MPRTFAYRLERQDGTPAEPPVLHTAVPTWDVGDTIPLGAGKSLRVIETRFASADDEPVLVVESEVHRRSRRPAKGSWVRATEPGLPSQTGRARRQG